MTELPTLYQAQIHRTKYSRWIEDEGRRETWDETVDRYLEAMVLRAREHGVELTTEILDELREGVLTLGVMPSMRALMTAGKALIRDNVAGYNCFTGDTTFLTPEGPKRLMDWVGTTQKVLTKDGVWEDAEIKAFGKQPLVEITLRPGERSRTKLRKTITATPDHRWLTDNREEVTDLREGDLIRFNGVAHGPQLTYAWIRGFGFGDGTIDTRGRARLRLCGAKDLAHVEMLRAYGHCSISYPDNWNGDALVCFHKGHFENWKQLPMEYAGAELGAWFQGYFCADGCDRDEQPILCSQDWEAIEFAKMAAPYAGYFVTGQNTDPVTETNYGLRSAPMQRLTLRREGVYRVMSVVDLDAEDEVFCAVEPRTGTFTLTNGVLTGNCAYLAINRPQAFDEALYILCCGTGVGFSVERQYINQLPEVPEPLYPSDTTIVVRDSKIGWASALRQLIHLLYSGVIPQWDVSKVRPAGSRLKTFGGRASGPGPLVDLFHYVIATFQAAQGRKLSSLECHGIMCKIGDVVVVGGVRRSALISLSNPSDDRMRDAKAGQWSDNHPEYALANNSAAWTEKPSMERFLDEWLSLIKSKSGERGIVNRAGMQTQAARNGRRDATHEFGTNPCSEIILRDRQFCNLSEVVVRADDTLASLKQKVRLATILGTLQSTFTDFRYLSAQWKRNCEEERLLGVSLTGIMDHPYLSDSMPVDGDQRGQFDDLLQEFWRGRHTVIDCSLAGVLQELRQVAIDANAEWAEKLGVNPSTAITCVKPSGTVSQLVDAASGIHPRWSQHYIRTNRGSKADPVAQFLYWQNIPSEDELLHPDTTWVFAYPIKAPAGSITRDQISALDQLRLWLVYAEHWCEHKPSITVYVRESEWLEVGAFVYKHWDRMSGVSFLPHSEHSYKQAPYQDITEADYDRLQADMPETLNWELLPTYEREDSTEGMRELACSAAGSCEI